MPSGLAFGGLEQAVKGFEEAIGHSRSCPGNDALKVVLNHPCHVLHGFERMTFVHHCLSIWRTILLCLRLRISRQSSRHCQARAACLLQAGALDDQVFQHGIKVGTSGVAESISVFE